MLDVFVGRTDRYPVFRSIDLIDQLAAEKPKEKLPSTYQCRIKCPCEAWPGEHQPIEAIEDSRLTRKRCQQMHGIGAMVVPPTPANHHAFIEIEVASADIADERMLRTRVDQVNALPTLP
ncbi:hypothetical protein XI05_18525 [Bradyrhizobium sp. CCBAU 11357]|nr:hypothetical protein [Bradyrhizobium sp. CCBAU 11357]